MQRTGRCVAWLRSVLLPAVAGCMIFAAAIASRAANIPGGGPLPDGNSPFVDCYGYANTVGTHEILNLKQLACTDGDPTCDQDRSCNGTCRFRARFCLGLANVAGCTPPPTIDRVRLNKGCPLEAPAGTSGSACGAFVDFEVPLRGAAQRRAGRKRCTAGIRASRSVSDRTDKDIYSFKCVAPKGGCPASPSGAFLF